MRKTYLFLLLLLLPLTLLGCTRPMSAQSTVNATRYGVSTDNTGEQNSAALQALIDELSAKGGTVYIPAGEYTFARNGLQTLGTHCIKMKSNVNIIGEGESTVLKPVGDSWYGLDMFYFNDYLDTGDAVYLENCRFENFVIDASGTSCKIYTSAGKGFMFNLFKNCHWTNVTVKYTDATGFGIDCPIDSTITACTAIGCGKAASAEHGGASGFGIGFGYSENESLRISDCKADGNKKFGFFFEHQGRFNDEKYGAVPTNTFTVTNCTASENLFGFGGIYSVNTTYDNCSSENSLRFGFLFENAIRTSAVNCQSENEGEAAFAILQTVDEIEYEVRENSFLGCTAKNAPIGVKIIGIGSEKPVIGNRIESCQFIDTEYAVYTEGKMQSLVLADNRANSAQNHFSAKIEFFENSGNDWNDKSEERHSSK